MISCTFENGSRAALRHVVVHGIVEKDGAILLVKRAGDMLETGKWSLPAGFLDRDETAAQGIIRELKEETGWDGEVVSLMRINTNPNRPHEDRQNISLDFIIKPMAKTGEPDAESSKIEWIPIDQLLPLDELAFDHGESIGFYLKYRRAPFWLPLVD